MRTLLWARLVAVAGGVGALLALSSDLPDLPAFDEPADLAALQAGGLMPHLRRLKRGLQTIRQDLLELENAVVELEAAIERDQEEATTLDLLSIAEVCEELGMGRSWVYQRLKSGDIPAIRLGHAIKVRRNDLQAYLEKQRYPGPDK